MQKLISKSMWLFVFVFMFLSLEMVDAKQTQTSICVSSGLYTITWDSSQYPDFNPHKLPENFYELEESDEAAFEWVKTSDSCYQADDGSYYSCPSPEDENPDFAAIGELKEVNGSYHYTNIDMTFNENTYTYTIKIKDIFNGKNVIRYVRNDNTINDSLNMNSSDIQRYAHEFVYSKNGYFTITGVKPSTRVYVEVYVKNSSISSCNGTFLGGLSFYTPNMSDEMVRNPAYHNPSSYYCDIVKKDIVIDESYKKEYIYECYNEKITYSEIDGNSELYNTIKSKYNTALEIYNAFPDIITNDMNSNNCLDGSVSTTKETIKLQGDYWGLNCYETFTVDPDGPKLVKAGNGFEYETKYKVSRVCSLTQLNKVKKKAQCKVKTWCEVQHENGKVSNNNDPTKGGPNEDFDQCVLECDGGSYTQSCINSCYNKVYGETSNRSLSFGTENIRPIPMIDTKIDNQPSVTKTGINIAGTIHRDSMKNIGDPDDVDGDGNYNFFTDKSPSGKWRKYQYYEATINGVYCKVAMSDWCAKASRYTVTVAYRSVEPDGCSEKAEEEYKAAIEASKKEFNEYKAIQTSYENIESGEHTIQIQDSYLKDSNGNSYMFEANSLNNPQVTVESKNSGSEGTQTTEKLGDSSNDSVTFSQVVTREKEFIVNLPVSYASKISGSIAYATKGDTTNAYQMNLKTSKTFNKLSKFSVVDFYTEGYKYYTSIWSNNINVDVTDKEVILQTKPDYPNNIKVIASGVGTKDGNVNSDFSSNMSCYYGVYNQYYVETEGGIQYIYRTIDLENMFPNRDARFNWTGTIKNNIATGAAVNQNESIYNDSIDPETLIEEIQTKGESIYQVSKDASEVDYEFVLTTENIRNIRKYNKKIRDYNGDGENNYLDYNMSCYKNNKGLEVCTSRFLDNIDGNSGTEEASKFVTYSVSGFGIDNRKAIAGCNNAINGTECDNIGN